MKGVIRDGQENVMSGEGRIVQTSEERGSEEEGGRREGSEGGSQEKKADSEEKIDAKVTDSITSGRERKKRKRTVQQEDCIKVDVKKRVKRL